MLSETNGRPAGLVELHRVGNLFGSEAVTSLRDAFALEVRCRRAHVDSELRRYVFERAPSLIGPHESSYSVRSETNLGLFPLS